MYFKIFLDKDVQINSPKRNKPAGVSLRAIEWVPSRSYPVGIWAKMCPQQRSNPWGSGLEWVPSREAIQ
jgi:hypothetical protein